MRKVIAACLLVLAVWVGAEIYSKGVDGALGGLFVGGLDESLAEMKAPADHSTSDRSLAAFQRAYNTSEKRVDRLLEQPGSQE